MKKDNNDLITFKLIAMKADVTLLKKDLNQYGEKFFIEIQAQDKENDPLKMSFEISEYEAERMLMLFNFTNCVKQGQFDRDEVHS